MTSKLIRFLPNASPADQRLAPARGPGAPRRGTVATSLDLPGLPPPRFAAVEVLWPADDTLVIPHESEDGIVLVPVDEVVVRGADALAARGDDGVGRFKMMSFGRRNPALTRAVFVERWRAEAGRLGGDRIPDELRGLAYVQHHPRGDDTPFDAINEVWFDRLDDLRRRAEWFAARPVPAGLMSPPECWSLYLHEVVAPTRQA